MRAMRRVWCALLLHSVCVVAQSQPEENVDVNTLDPDFVSFPEDDGVDYDGCFQDLAGADVNGDGAIQADEYFGFVQAYAKRVCHFTNRLTLQQRSTFNALACRCQTREGFPPDCCLGPNAQIETAGALDPETRSQEQLGYLQAVCRVTDQTIGEPRGCPPYVWDPDGQPPIDIVPKGPDAPVAGGLSKGALAGIIVGAILLALLILLCCCCCVIRRRKAAAAEESDELRKEEVATQQQGGGPGDAEQGFAPPIVAGQEQQSAPPPPGDYGHPPPPDTQNAAGFVPMPLGVAAGPYDEESSEEYRATSGTAVLENEEDPKNVRAAAGQTAMPLSDDEDGSRKLHGEGILPEEQSANERVQLRPFDATDENGLPSWDDPGQAITFPTEKDDLSSGDLDHFEPDGGAYLPERGASEVSDWNSSWHKPEKDDSDEEDDRKHRIQAGLGEGEVWDKLGEQEERSKEPSAGGGDMFDWVVQSALGVLHDSQQADFYTSYNPDDIAPGSERGGAPPTDVQSRAQDPRPYQNMQQGAPYDARTGVEHQAPTDVQSRAHDPQPYQYTPQGGAYDARAGPEGAVPPDVQSRAHDPQPYQQTHQGAPYDARGGPIPPPGVQSRAQDPQPYQQTQQAPYDSRPDQVPPPGVQSRAREPQPYQQTHQGAPYDSRGPGQQIPPPGHTREPQPYHNSHQQDPYSSMQGGPASYGPGPQTRSAPAGSQEQYQQGDQTRYGPYPGQQPDPRAAPGAFAQPQHTQQGGGCARCALCGQVKPEEYSV